MRPAPLNSGTQTEEPTLPLTHPVRSFFALRDAASCRLRLASPLRQIFALKRFVNSGRGPGDEPVSLKPCNGFVDTIGLQDAVIDRLETAQDVLIALHADMACVPQVIDCLMHGPYGDLSSVEPCFTELRP